jgi:ribosomal protein S27AE
MLDFVKSAFRSLLEVILWVNLILCTIGGWIIGKGLGGFMSDGHPILGAFIGLIIGLLLDIIGGGFIATILKIDENLEQLKNSIKSGYSPLNLRNIDSAGKSQDNKKCKKCGNLVDSGYTSCPHCGASILETTEEIWICKNCGMKNRLSESQCKGCGIYK